LRGEDDAGAKEEDGSKEFDGYVCGERVGGCGGVFVGGVDADEG
jgi:hypothetical protein